MHFYLFRKTLCILTLMLLPHLLSCQSRKTINGVSRYGVWLTPTGSRNVTINGIAIGPISQPTDPNASLRVNGINLEVFPITILMSMGAMILTFSNPIMADSYAEEQRITSEIHGLSISGGILEPVKMHGTSINWISYAGISEGLEMSLVSNSNYSFNGEQLSMWGNRAVDGKGIQVGLFNSCQDGSVVQIGFLNRIGKRVLPGINFNFKRKKRVDRVPPVVITK